MFYYELQNYLWIIILFPLLLTLKTELLPLLLYTVDIYKITRPFPVVFTRVYYNLRVFFRCGECRAPVRQLASLGRCLLCAGNTESALRWNRGTICWFLRCPKQTQQNWLLWRCVFPHHCLPFVWSLIIIIICGDKKDIYYEYPPSHMYKLTLVWLCQQIAALHYTGRRRILFWRLF